MQPLIHKLRNIMYGLLLVGGPHLIGSMILFVWYMIALFTPCAWCFFAGYLAVCVQGQGVARQRKAIVDGMRTSVEEFSRDVDVIDAKDVIQLIVVNQYFDTMKEIARGENSNIIFAPKRRK
eukprot:GHVT01045926.1.p2 GENE.GHVT01045926.1~~GHVT01045926.1.p2  ORF type:complete len:122 (-),score=9.64 GHVT01045926.1:634-999(-)